jgi:pyridoxine 5-phosphate synthase
MAATLALLGGADGITVHLREDRRHIRDRDLELLRRMLQGPELNLEMAPTREMLQIALRIRPQLCTLVPERRAELTTEGGLDVPRLRRRLRDYVRRLKDGGLRVSLFINPDAQAVEASAQVGAHMVEVHTGFYADAPDEASAQRELARVSRAVALAQEAGLVVNAGHGLNYLNVKPVAALRGLRGLYIGHSIISRAVLVGLTQAVRQMKALIAEASE